MRMLLLELLFFGVGLSVLIFQISAGVALTNKPIERDEQPGLFWCIMLFEAAVLAVVTLVALSRWG